MHEAPPARPLNLAPPPPPHAAVTLGVEFGGGYELKYDCYQKPGGPEVTPDTVSAQANSMYSVGGWARAAAACLGGALLHTRPAPRPLPTSPPPPTPPPPARPQDCVNAGHSNCVVQYYQPSSINVLIPGVSTKEEIAPVLDAFAKQPLGLKLTFSISLSGVLGSQDLQDTVRAAGIAFGVVWAVLLLRYWAAGALGLFITIVFLWLLMIFFNASPSVLSEAAIVAFVLNIGLAADAHILTFERAREELHKLPYGAPIEDGLAALQTGMRRCAPSLACCGGTQRCPQQGTVASAPCPPPHTAPLPPTHTPRPLPPPPTPRPLPPTPQTCACSAMVTILEANVTTIICMLTLYVVGVGPVSDFAFMIMISVSCRCLAGDGVAASAGGGVRARARSSPCGRSCCTSQQHANPTPPAGGHLAAGERPAGAAVPEAGLECWVHPHRCLLWRQGACLR